MMKKVLFLLGVVASGFGCFNSLNDGLVFAADVVNSANLNENSFNDLMNEVVTKNGLSAERNEEGGSKAEGENKKERVFQKVFDANSLKKTDDFVNCCYVDSYDCDYHGRMYITLFSESDSNSVFYGHNNIRMEFFNEAGEKVLEKNAVNEFANEPVDANEAGGKKRQGNSVKDVIDKFDIKFGPVYLVKFFDGENLLGYSFLDVLAPKLSDEASEFKFAVAEKGTFPYLNVCLPDSDKAISDRLKFNFEKTGEEEVVLTLNCLSNDNNDDSVFKNVDSLNVDFIGENGDVLFSAKTDNTQVDDRLKVVKNKKLVLPKKPIKVLNDVVSFKFYDGADDSKSKPIASYFVRKDGATENKLIASYFFSAGSHEEFD